MTRIYALAASVAVVALVGGVAVAIQLGQAGADEFAQCRGSAVAGDIGGPFELITETGDTVTDETLITEPTLVYFGYTFCPDVCPLDSARNAEAVDYASEGGYSVTPLFISVDPRRDTPEVLADFTDNFHPDMIGLTGSREQIDQAVGAYRAYYDIRDDEGDEEFYLIDHSAFTYLVLPEHGFVDFFRRETAPQEMADRIACYADAAS